MAEEELEKAWKLDPTLPQIGKDMIWVCIGRGHNREVMEKWFQRAMVADEDYLDAGQAKLEYLHPKWHGRKELMLGFAQQFAATKNWDSDIPLIVIQRGKNSPGTTTAAGRSGAHPAESGPTSKASCGNTRSGTLNPLIFTHFTCGWRTSVRECEDALGGNALIAGRYRRSVFHNDESFKEFVAYFSAPEIREQSKQALQARQEREKKEKK